MLVSMVNIYVYRPQPMKGSDFFNEEPVQDGPYNYEAVFPQTLGKCVALRRNNRLDLI